MRLTDVLQPIKINKVEVKNRIFRPAHGTRFGDGGVTDRMIAYHEERAKGGVGLSYLELVVVHPSAGEVSGIISWRDGFVESVRRLTDTMHHYDMKMFAQLWHGGRQVADRDGIAWSASHVRALPRRNLRPGPCHGQ